MSDDERPAVPADEPASDLEADPDVAPDVGAGPDVETGSEPEAESNPVPQAESETVTPPVEAPTETERLVVCYLDAAVPDDRRDEISEVVRARLANRRGGSRAQVLAVVHEVVEEHVEIPPVDAGVALIRECGLTPLAASLIVGLNREELEVAAGLRTETVEDETDAVAAESSSLGGEPDTSEASDVPDDDAMAILSEDYWTPAADTSAVSSAGTDAATTASTERPRTGLDPGIRPVPLSTPPARPERYDTWSGGPGEPAGRAIPAVAAIVALFVVAVVAVALTITRGPDGGTAAPPADDGAEAVDPPEPPEQGDGADGTGGEETDVTGPPAEGGIDVSAPDGGGVRAGEPAVASFAVPDASDDLLWTLASDGDELFAPTPLVVPPGSTGEVRLLIPSHFVRDPGDYTLRVLAGGEVVVEHAFSVAEA